VEWKFVLALVLAVPIVLFPVAFIWYLNIGGIYNAIIERRRRRIARKHGQEKTAPGFRKPPVDKIDPMP